MKTCSVRDDVHLTSREITPEGYLVAPGTLARTGIQHYLAQELGLDDLPPTRALRLHRPAAEVFDAASVASFEAKPITVGHPESGSITAENWHALAVGDVREVAAADGYLTGKLVIRDKRAVDTVQAG